MAFLEHWNDEDEDEKFQEYLDKKYKIDDMASLNEIRIKEWNKMVEQHEHYMGKKSSLYY